MDILKTFFLFEIIFSNTVDLDYWELFSSGDLNEAGDVCSSGAIFGKYLII